MVGRLAPAGGGGRKGTCVTSVATGAPGGVSARSPVPGRSPRGAQVVGGRGSGSFMTGSSVGVAAPIGPAIIAPRPGGSRGGASDPELDALAQRRRQPRLDHAPHLLRVVARAQVGADQQLVLEAV